MTPNTQSAFRPELNPKNILKAAFGKKWKKLRTKRGKYLLDKTTLTHEEIVDRINDYLHNTCSGALDCKSFEGLCTLVVPPVYSMGLEGTAAVAWSLNSLFSDLEVRFGEDEYPNINLDGSEEEPTGTVEEADFLSVLYNNGGSPTAAEAKMTPIDVLAEIISSAFPDDEGTAGDSAIGKWAPDSVTENGALVSKGGVVLPHEDFVSNVNLRLCNRGIGTLVSKGPGKRATVLLKPKYGAGFPGEVIKGDGLIDTLVKMEQALDAIGSTVDDTTNK